MLESEYGEWLVRGGPEKEQEYDVSLLIDLEKIPEEEGEARIFKPWLASNAHILCARRGARIPRLPPIHAQAHDPFRALPPRVRITQTTRRRARAGYALVRGEAGRDDDRPLPRGGGVLRAEFLGSNYGVYFDCVQGGDGSGVWEGVFAGGTLALSVARR